MGSRIREKPEHFFEVFVEIAKPEGTDDAPFIIQKFPLEFEDKEALMMIPKFAYPCKTEVSTVDHFTFVLTDIDSMFRFGYCRHATGHQTCLCIVSCLPWFEIFYKLLDYIADITNKSENNNATQFLEKCYAQDVPSPKIPVTIVANNDMFSFTPPDPNILPSLSSNRNLKEYYSAVDHENMMKIFASMLHERRIYMTSKKLSRLTASIHAAESMLYPMHWQHLYIPILPAHLIDYISAPMPYLIGVHKNLIEKLIQNRVDVGDAVVVDLDNNIVTTTYDDLGDLPHSVSNFLKKKLKKDSKETLLYTGDAVSRAFLQAIVRLIGGYRDALEFRPGNNITFNPQKFIQSRPDSQPFLEGMLSLQIFQQFIRGRLEKLETVGGFTDIFDEESHKYRDEVQSKRKVKDLLQKAQKSGTNSLMKLRRQSSKAAPMMSTAVQSLTGHSKKVMTSLKTTISGLTAESEERKNTEFRVSGGLVHSKPVSHTSSLRGQRPPRPPPPNKSYSKPETTKVAQNLEEPLDDNSLRLSYHTPNVSLMEDVDIQAAIHRCASAEMLSENYSIRQGSSGSCSTPSSDSVGENDIPFDALQSSDEDSESSGVSNVDTPNFVPADKLIRHQSDRLILSAGNNPIPPPREKKLNRISPQSTPAVQLRNPPTAVPRRASSRKEKTEEVPPAVVHEAPLIKFDSTESEITDSDIFDPLTPGGISNDNTDETFDGKILRNQSSRVSLIRSQAFKRENPVIIKPRVKDEDDLDFTSSLRDSSTDIFDPLYSSNQADEDSAPMPDPLPNHSPRRESSDLLQHKWTLASLPRGPNITLPMGQLTLFQTPAYNIALGKQSIPINPSFDASQPRATNVIQGYSGVQTHQRVSLPPPSMNRAVPAPGKLPASKFAPYANPQTSKLPQYQTQGNLSSPKLGQGNSGTPLSLSTASSPSVSPVVSRSSTPAITKNSDLFGDLVDFGNSFQKPDKMAADPQVGSRSVEPPVSQKSKWETFE